MTDLVLTDLSIGTKELVNGEYTWAVANGATPGILDRLLTIVNDNIGIQYDNGRIKDDKYADVYLASLQSAIAQGMGYFVQEKQVEKQVDLLVKDLELKDMQLAGMAKDLELKAAQAVAMAKDIDIKNAQLESIGIDNMTKKLDMAVKAAQLDSLLLEQKLAKQRLNTERE